MPPKPNGSCRNRRRRSGFSKRSSRAVSISSSSFLSFSRANTGSGNVTSNGGGRVRYAHDSVPSDSFTFASSTLTSFSRWSSDAQNFRGVMQSVSDSTWSCSGFGLHAPNSDLRSGSGTYPIIYASPSGTISVMLKMGVIVEMTVDRAVRVLCHDTFSSVWNSLGTSACILHPNARIYQHDENVFCNFGTFPNPTYKMGTIVPGGVFFRMPHMPFAYMVSSTAVRGTVAVYLEQNQFPALSYDFTLAIFYAESMNGPEYAHVCNEVVKKARHRRRRDGSITLTINGIFIKQAVDGDVEVNLRPRYINCSPSKGTIRVHADMVDMAAQEDNKAYAVRGMQRIHVSRSGLLASDGRFVASIDHTGRLI